MDIKIVSRNRKASHEYFLFDQLEAGLVLNGSEIKSIRAGQMSLTEAYIRIDGSEAWLIDSHVAPYDHSGRFIHDPRGTRKLLLHKKEILKLWNTVRQKGVTIIPIMVYLKGGRAKIQIAVAKGKKLYDKRQAIAKKDNERDLERQYRLKR